ncbi:MAG: hypothetical protein K5930_04650 [Treponemataceae bacterium]|nr:hypothetical protein [Treponemataceae bacterium]
MRTIECGSLPERGGWSVVCEETDYLVVAKGAGIPCAPLKNGAYSLFESLSSSFPDLLSVHGKKEGEGGLIHRIDTETCGLVLIARSDSFYNHILELTAASSFSKTYTAYTIPQKEGLPEPCIIKSRFRPYGKKRATVRPLFEEGGLLKAGTADRKKAGKRIYATEILSSSVLIREKGKDLVRVSCSIKEGFRHQVRSHLAYSSFPVLGDKLYGGPLSSCEDMLFFASGLSFTETDGNQVEVRIPYSVMDEKAVCEFRIFLTSLTR